MPPPVLRLRVHQPTVDGLVAALRAAFDEQNPQAGIRFDSIRQLAQRHGLSRYAVIEAYDRLVAAGYLEARRGSGFYVSARSRETRGPTRAATPEAAYEVAELIRRVLEDDSGALRVGGPWLPDSWLDPAKLQAVLRTLSRRPGGLFLQYGQPLGYAPLRRQLQRLVGALDMHVTPEQILLTAGTSQALDLVTRHMLQPGDVVMVDDPGYYHLFAYLRWYGVRLVAIPRLVDGPDIAALRSCAAKQRPKVYFTQTAMQNPTGSTMTLAVMHRVLAAATEFGFRIVEDDTYNDLEAEPGPRLATLDGFERVVYLRSFSKTISGSFRVGCIVCNLPTIDALTRAKVLTSITSSQFSEMVIHQLLVEGHYRKFLDRLRVRIDAAMTATVARFEALGLELFCRPRAGNFLWARVPGIDDAATLQPEAERHQVILAPGAVFRPHLEPSPWMRFNVALCDDPRLTALLRAAGAGAGRGGPRAAARAGR